MKLSVLASSSSGNSIYIEHNNFRCLVDAGLTGKKVVENLAQIERDIKDINAIFVTHEHIDHIKGVGVLARKYNIPVYANALTWQNMTKCGEINSDLKFHFEKEESKVFDDVVVNSFGVSHDAINPQFYTFECEGKRVSILTDMGHLSNTDSANYLTKIVGDNTRNVFLAHLSEQNNTKELARMAADMTLKHKDIDCILEADKTIDCNNKIVIMDTDPVVPTKVIEI